MHIRIVQWKTIVLHTVPCLWCIKNSKEHGVKRLKTIQVSNWCNGVDWPQGGTLVKISQEQDTVHWAMQAVQMVQWSSCSRPNLFEWSPGGSCLTSAHWSKPIKPRKNTNPSCASLPVMRNQSCHSYIPEPRFEYCSSSSREFKMSVPCALPITDTVHWLTPANTHD